MLTWMLKQVMADKGIRTGVELARLLWEKAGYRLSAPSVSALINGEPKQMKADTLDALCTALDCKPGDLWAHTPSRVRGAS
ncbi:helix-turn-helix domain-containing protein [Paenibacillus ginsengihumi]|uniref:helix-turn-helix domain-containing protein n=1 Tax=Paenibacillus ginsengihumi TaxID=431596 RepID=UPI0003763CB2|nr:helix-turn-helix transcriptional regulator [Paenibacillus ginsengihumi]